jgi:hypothetical protein
MTTTNVEGFCPAAARAWEPGEGDPWGGAAVPPQAAPVSTASSQTAATAGRARRLARIDPLHLIIAARVWAGCPEVSNQRADLDSDPGRVVP